MNVFQLTRVVPESAPRLGIHICRGRTVVIRGLSTEQVQYPQPPRCLRLRCNLKLQPTKESRPRAVPYLTLLHVAPSPSIMPLEGGEGRDQAPASSRHYAIYWGEIQIDQREGLMCIKIFWNNFYFQLALSAYKRTF